MQSQSVWSPSRIAAERTVRRRSGYYVCLNLWPFVAVMITLLILFMVDTKPPHYHAWYAAHLPSVKHPIAQPNATREDSIRISVTRDGLVFLPTPPPARPNCMTVFSTVISRP